MLRQFPKVLHMLGILVLMAGLIYASPPLRAETSDSPFPLSPREQKVGVPTGTNAVINNHKKTVDKTETLLREIQNELQRDKCLRVKCETYRRLYAILAELTEAAGGAKGNLYATLTELDNEIFSARLNVERLGFYIDTEYRVVGWQNFFMSFANDMENIVRVTDLAQEWAKKGATSAFDRLAGMLYKKLIISGVPEGEARDAVRVASRFVSVRGLVEGDFSVDKASNLRTALGKAVISALKPFAEKSINETKRKLEEYKKTHQDEQQAIETLISYQGIVSRLYARVKGIKAELKKERDAVFGKAENCGMKQRQDCSDAYQKTLDAAKTEYDATVKAGEETIQSLIKEFNEISRHIDQSRKQFNSIDEKAEKIKKEQNDLFDDTAKYEAHEKTISDIDERLKNLPSGSSARATLATNKIRLQQEMQQLKSKVEKYRKLEKQYTELRSKTGRIVARMERDMKNENHLRERIDRAWQARKEEKKQATERYERQAKDAKKAYEACRAKTSTVSQYRGTEKTLKTRKELIRMYSGFLNMEPFNGLLNAQQSALQKLESMHPEYRRVEDCTNPENKKDLKDIAAGERENQVPEEAAAATIDFWHTKAAQKIIAENDYAPVKELVNLSGCWMTWGSSLGENVSIFQYGKQVVATFGFEGEELVFTGEFEPPEMELSSTDIWKHRNWFEYSVTTDDSELSLLSKAKPEALMRIKAWIASSDVSDWGFGVKNSHGIDINLYLGGYVLPSTLFPTVDSNYRTVLKKSPLNVYEFHEIPPPFDYEERNRVYEKYEGIDQSGMTPGGIDAQPWWSDMNVWEKMPRLSEFSVHSIEVVDADSNPVEELEANDRFWIRAKSEFGCPDIRDHFAVTVFPMGDRGSAITVMLEETGPDTLEFRSPAEGVPLTRVFAKKNGKNEDQAIEPLNAAEEFGEEIFKKPEKDNAKEEKKAVSSHKERQEIVDVGAQAGKKNAGFTTVLNRNKSELIAEKKWLEKELENRKNTLNTLGQAKALFIRHYSSSEGKKLTRLEITESPELSRPGFKLDQTDSVLFMQKAKEHLNREIGEIETDIIRINKELEGPR